jgi:hypothetical protein
MAFGIGFYTSGDVNPIKMGLMTLYITGLLAILEVSLSFDNAVKNAAVLKHMEPKWQDRFLIWGLPIAVFGMRFVFPILIVMIASGTGMTETFMMAIENPKEYHEILESSINYIYAFGGAFLLMVALEFFFDEEKEDHWFNIIENNKFMKKASTIPAIEITVSLFIGVLLTYFTKDYNISIAYYVGIILYTLLSMIDDAFSGETVKNGLVGLLYLEVLDASFSFDGVIGAFALSTNIFIIMLGLGIGAMFVRSLTLLFVHNGTLDEYKYLEHGAHYAIASLAIIMFIKMFIEIPEVITGTIGIGFIGIAFYSSIRANKQS